MIDCPHCHANVHPSKELEVGGGFTDICPQCAGVIGRTVVQHTEVGVVQSFVGPVAKPAALRAEAPSPVDALRARLSAVEAQIPTPEQMKALRRERAQLRAALRALGVELDPKPN